MLPHRASACAAKRCSSIPQPVNSSCFSTDVEEKRLRSAAFTDVEESCGPPQRRKECHAESVTEILSELNIGEALHEVPRIKVINPARRHPVKVVFSNGHVVEQVLRHDRALKG
ncbi:unnamed protein product [Toxocara canis]|uniref:Uncharacterized protein n=1 Tax=Toxocara canis TaxID=6265 RepID=A0A183TW28_TOXCA|nr:unnamed protein product [Toxocara canis]